MARLPDATLQPSQRPAGIVDDDAELAVNHLLLPPFGAPASTAHLSNLPDRDIKTAISTSTPQGVYGPHPAVFRDDRARSPLRRRDPKDAPPSCLATNATPEVAGPGAAASPCQRSAAFTLRGGCHNARPEMRVTPQRHQLLGRSPLHPDFEYWSRRGPILPAQCMKSDPIDEAATLKKEKWACAGLASCDLDATAPREPRLIAWHNGALCFECVGY